MKSLRSWLSGAAAEAVRSVRIRSLSLAEKCRLLFGGAMLLTLLLALSIPYFWMGKLAQKSVLDAGRAITELIFERHFQQISAREGGRPLLTELGHPADPNEYVVRWIRLDQTEQQRRSLEALTKTQMEKLEELLADEHVQDAVWYDEQSHPPRNHYLRLVRAQDTCLQCHSKEGSAVPFNLNQQVGVLVVRMLPRETARTALMNRLCVIFAGLIAGTGAVIAFYMITQRVILRPVRQLRGLVNNIAEGNLEIRSAIKTGDEFERLSDAFNHMLDNLLQSQKKLQEANRQLDAKIAELSEKNIELYKANKLKSEFLANMSHEFRTPLNAILGFAQLLYEKPASDPDKCRRWAENILTSGRSLLNLINDLLDLAKAESGKMVLHIEKTSITELCEGLVAFFSPLTEQKRLKVRLQMEDNLPLVQTDPGKVQQILYNLLSNAVKFTPEEGRIHIQVSRPDERSVRISIADTGPGIPKDQQEHIFEKFRQLDGSLTRKEPGTGLGLAICKQLAELLAGTIEVESDVGKGSIFSLTIPIALPKGAESNSQGAG
ncbi:MAG TPA: HAMP domain-containing sensor histidine kinase [Anaerohalosphaeraceae bacterium]|nr:HAMP domain-containing sensor histidine kinase [Anaerohalosphaeraceae bacterium]HOL88656.1 HAMP domain-containing sensor histidine kinase [Anaerohalosphaeraceae bacterium]HPP57063.1 HAMP domain-containing sensor histidine kinase [Anaerohalosphaeraceae bacterium]